MLILLPVMAFLFVSLLAYAAYIAFAPSLAGNVERRLAEIGGNNAAVETPPWERLAATFKRMGQVAPQSPSEMGLAICCRTSFWRGWRSAASTGSGCHSLTPSTCSW